MAARHREGLRLIPVEEIQFFFAEQKYTTVRHLKGEDLIDDSLRALEEEFAADFVRIHRNALVSVRHLEASSAMPTGSIFVRLKGCAAPLQVSRRMARRAARAIPDLMPPIRQRNPGAHPARSRTNRSTAAPAEPRGAEKWRASASISAGGPAA